MSIHSWKENLNDSDLLSSYNFNDCQEPQIEQLDKSMFGCSMIEANALVDKTNLPCSEKVGEFMKEKSGCEIMENFNSISSINHR